MVTVLLSVKGTRCMRKIEILSVFKHLNNFASKQYTGKPEVSVTDFVAIFTLLQRSGTEPTISEILGSFRSMLS